MGSQNCTDIVNLKMKERNAHTTSETCQVKLKLQFHNKFDPWDAIHVEDNQYIWYGSKNIIRLLERSLEKFNWKPISRFEIKLVCLTCMPYIQRFSKTIILKNLKSNTDNDELLMIINNGIKKKLFNPYTKKCKNLKCQQIFYFILITLRVFYKNCDENKLLQIIIIFL
jgi:hypothetical protein